MSPRYLRTRESAFLAHDKCRAPRKPRKDCWWFNALPYIESAYGAVTRWGTYRAYRCARGAK